MESRQVLREANGYGRVVFEESHGAVAAHAQQAANALAAGVAPGTARMVVVDGEPGATRVRLVTACADASLGREQFVVGGQGQVVVRHQPPAEFTEPGVRSRVARGVVALHALPCLVGGPTAAVARDDKVRRARAAARPDLHARAKQRVADSVSLRSHEDSDFFHGLPVIGVQPSDFDVLFSTELSFLSHEDIVSHQQVSGDLSLVVKRG